MAELSEQNKFDRDKTCYEQNFEQARSLNIQMNGIPVLSVTLTGGLWFGVVSANGIEKHAQFGLLVFAGICNIVLALSAVRIRDVFQSYLDKIEEFNPSATAKGIPKKPLVPCLRGYSMILLLCSLMFTASFLSFLGAFEFYWPFEASSRIAWIILVTFCVLICLFLIITFWLNRH